MRSGTFAIVYNCGAGDVTVNVAAAGSTTGSARPQSAVEAIADSK